jgi:hypothetical protein
MKRVIADHKPSRLTTQRSSERIAADMDAGDVGDFFTETASSNFRNRLTSNPKRAAK